MEFNVNPLSLFTCGGKVDVFRCPLLLHYTCEEEDRSGDKMVCETMLDPVADLPRPKRRDRMRGKLASSNYFNHPSYQTHDLLLICVNKLLLFSDKLIEPRYLIRHEIQSKFVTDKDHFDLSRP